MIQTLFKRINKRFFNSSLPYCPIELRSRKVKIIMGQTEYHRIDHPKIIIYTCHNKTAEILAHEMVHLHQACSGGKMQHNQEFYDMEHKIVNWLKK